LTGWHNSNGSYSFDGKKLNAKKNVNLNFIFASTANVKPLTANRGLRSGVNKINVNLKVSNMPRAPRNVNPALVAGEFFLLSDFHQLVIIWNGNLITLEMAIKTDGI
jgi:hypothetical protein